MSQIFVSYSHDDGEFVTTLANDLLDRGYDVWVDFLNLPGGTMWESSIFEAIAACDIMLLIWSGNVANSEFTKREVQHSATAGKTIIPLIIGGDKNALWTDLAKRQWIDFSANQDYPTALTRLIAELPEPEQSYSPPGIEQLLDRGDTKFGSASRGFRSKLEYGTDDNSAVGLLLKRHPLGLQTFLVGKREARIKRPECVQVFFNVSRLVEQDSFRDFLMYVNAANIDLFAVLIRGPIVNTKNGLSYWLPDDSRVYEAAVSRAWSGVAAVADEATPLHLYVNGPVALAAAFTAAQPIRRPLMIYQLNMQGKGANRYFVAYSHNVRN